MEITCEVYIDTTWGVVCLNTLITCFCMEPRIHSLSLGYLDKR